jgi:hypothetical protein
MLSLNHPEIKQEAVRKFCRFAADPIAKSTFGTNFFPFLQSNLFLASMIFFFFLENTNAQNPVNNYEIMEIPHDILVFSIFCGVGPIMCH